MNKICVFLLLLFSVFSYSQIDTLSFETKYKDKHEEFDAYAKPSPTNHISRYFKNRINTNLLDAVKFRDTIENKKRIFLVFRLNKINELTGLYANSAYSELNKSIVDAFKKYDIEKLNIQDKSPLNTYVLQIISSENGQAIVNCSSEVIYDRLPIFNGCELTKTNNEVKKCINKSIEDHILKNISFKEIQKAKILGELKLSVKFLVDFDGSIKNVNCKAPTDDLTAELNRVVKMMPNAKVFPTRNGIPTFLEIKEDVFLMIEPTTERFKEDVLKHTDTLLSENSNLALHFKKYLNENELKSIIFTGKQKYIMLSFGIDKKGRYIDVSNNLKLKPLSDKMNEVLKKYPIEKHGISTPELLSSYSYTVITKGYDGNSIQTENEPKILVPPMFKGCGKSGSANELKKCTSNEVASIITKEFDQNLRHKTDLKGDIRIYCIFRVDTDGNIVNVKVKAPNPYLANEVESIIKSIPPAIKAGTVNGKPVIVPYSLPIVFRVGENTPENPFKSLIKKQ